MDAGLVMHQLIGLIRSSPLTIDEIAARSGIKKYAIQAWGVHTSPNIQNVEAVIAVLGFRLLIVPDEEMKEIGNG